MAKTLKSKRKVHRVVVEELSGQQLIDAGLMTCADYGPAFVATDLETDNYVIAWHDMDKPGRLKAHDRCVDGLPRDFDYEVIQ